MFKKLSIFFDTAYKKHCIGVYAAHATLFILMSSVPFLMILISLIQYIIPVDKNVFIEFVNTFFPTSIQNTARDVVVEVFSKKIASILSVTTIVLLFSASRGIYGLMLGLEKVNGVENENNFLSRNFKSLIYTIIFMIAIILSIVVLVFGSSLYNLFTAAYPEYETYINIVHYLRYILPLIILICIFLVGYRVLPKNVDKKSKCLPGAVIASISWIIFSMIFSLYASNYANYSYVYGSLAFIVIAMLWLYFCMNLFLLGAEFNVMFCQKKESSVESF